MNALKTDAKKKLPSVENILFVKFVVGKRFKTLLKQELNKLGIQYHFSRYGAIHFSADTTCSKIREFKKRLDFKGLHYLDENNSRLLDKIIHLIGEVIQSHNKLPRLSFTEITKAEKGSAHETFLNNFSEVLGMSIPQFIVMQKIERIKELLLYEDLPLSEIANMLFYKNEQLMAAQFKKYTGLTPSYFKHLKYKRTSLATERAENLYPPIQTAEPVRVFNSVYIDSI